MFATIATVRKMRKATTTVAAAVVCGRGWFVGRFGKNITKATEASGDSGTII